MRGYNHASEKKKKKKHFPFKDDFLKSSLNCRFQAPVFKKPLPMINFKDDFEKIVVEIDTLIMKMPPPTK